VRADSHTKILVRLTLGVCLVLAGLCGCDTRDYDNPLDSRNPDTGGIAPGFNAIAGDGEVTLTWPNLGIRDPVSVQILKWPATGDPETLGVFPLEVSECVDRSVTNGSRYEYRAKYNVEDDPTVHLSNSDVAMPGTDRAWVVDERWGGLYRIAPDGRDVAWKIDYPGYLGSLAVDEERRRVWFASWSTDEVVGVDSTGAMVTVIPIESPRRIAVFRPDGSIWVTADWGVGRYSLTGQVIAEDLTVSNPKDVVVDQVLGTCWVAEGTGSVWIRDANGSTVRVFGFDYPFSLSLESSGAAWLVDAGALRVYRLAAGNGAPIGWVGGFAQPVDVAAIPSGGAWVADWGADSVVRIDAGLGRAQSVGGFSRPRGVAVGGAEGSLWVVEARGGRVVKLTGDGERLASSGGLDFPKDIALDPGTGR